MLDEWGGCGFPPARPSWLTDLWMTLSPPLPLRSHIQQQCHICPAAQSATIWNGFVLRTPKWWQITLLAVLCHSGCCRWWLPKHIACYSQYCLRCRSFEIADCWFVEMLDVFGKVLLLTLFLCRRGCLAAKRSCPVWPWCRPAPWPLHPKKWWLHLAMHHRRERDLTALLRAIWSSHLEWAVHPWLGPTWEMWSGNWAVLCCVTDILKGVNTWHNSELWNSECKRSSYCDFSQFKTTFAFCLAF